MAEENGIPLATEECRFRGECDGTCPRCEAEVRYLEDALAGHIRIGKVATVAGLALGLTATAQAQATVDTLPDTTATTADGRMQHLNPLMPNDAPEAVYVTRRLRSSRPLAGVLTAEIQVILGGTPANIGTEMSGSRFYDEKKEESPRVKVQ